MAAYPPTELRSAHGKILTMRKPGALFAIALVVVTLAGNAVAADASDAQAYLADARKLLQKGDPKAALIQLKNAVQADADNGAARFELGALEMRLGDLLSAEKELRAALERKYDRDKVEVLLAETLLRLNRSQDVLNEMLPRDRPPAVEASILVSRGYAFLNLRQPEDAKASFEKAVAIGPNPIRAQLGLSHAVAAAGDISSALEFAQKSLDGDPRFVEAWIYMGQLRRVQADLPGARKSFDTALSINPNDDIARLDRASLLIATNELSLAAADVGIVLKLNPQQPLANYLQALIAAKNKDFSGAETSLQKLKSNLNNYPPALFLLAAVNLAQNQLAQAEENINRFLAGSPNDDAGTALLATLLLKRGNTARAIQVLKAASDAKPTVRLLGMLGDAYLRAKQSEAAAAVYDRISALAPDDASVLTSVAAQKLRLGRAEGALGDLAMATDLAPKSTQTGLLLVLALLQDNRIDEAMTVGREISARIPDDPLPENLLGAIALRKGDAAEARSHFERSLQINPEFVPARLNLGQLALSERRSDDARASFDKVLKTAPDNLTALLGEADLSVLDGKRDDAVAWLEKARNRNPSAIDPRVRLVEAYLEAKDPTKAAAVADELEQVAPNEPRAVNAVGEARLANNEAPRAAAAFDRLIQLSPRSGAAQLQRARAAYAAEDDAAAQSALDKAVELAPDDLTIEQQLVRFTLETNGLDRELAYLNGLAAAAPDDPTFNGIAGDLLAAAGHRAAAMSAYAEGLAKRANSPGLVVKLAQLQPDPAAEVDFLQNWLKKYPDDVSIRILLGGILLSLGRDDEAIAVHERLLQNAPDNPLVLNNLAWLYHGRNDARAVAMAEKAVRLAPDRQEIQDTLAWILVQNGANERGLEILEKISAATSAPDVQYHLAVAQKNAGRRGDARRTLNSLLNSDKPFASSAAAKALLKELSGS
ncbi:MAG: prsT [Rhodospirillales bacterium]|nr:prsT [Rhodospirillales bacterium]